MYKIEFINSKAYINNLPVYILPLNTIIILYKFLENLETKKIDEIQENITEMLIECFKVELKKELNIIDLPKLLKMVNSTGFGEIELSHQNKDKNKYIFKCNNSIYTQTYYNLYNTYPKLIPINIYIIKKFFEEITKKKSKITNFHKNNIYYIEIEMLEENIENNNLNLRLDLKKKFENNKNKNNQLLNKVIINNQIKSENGKINIWNMSIVAIPTFFFNFNDAKINKYLEILGRAQGKTAYLIMKNLFGSKDKLSLFQNIFLQSELIGAGESKLINLDFEKKEIIIKYPENMISNNKITTFGHYGINIILEAIANILETEINYEIKDNTVYYFSTNKEEKENLELEEILKYLGIKKIITSKQ